MDPSAQHQELFGDYKRRDQAVVVSCNSSKPQPSSHQLQTQDHHQKKSRPQPEQSLKCPRCDSTNTKFCYYNNYSLSQPRYFCKSCRRYWTKGGTLRNIPVGGGCRKNRRSSSSASSTARIKAQDPSNDAKMIPGNFCGYNDQIDLGLAFALFHKQPSTSGGNNMGQLGFHEEQLSIFGNSVDDVLGNSTSATFGVSQNVGMENAGYALGNAAGLDQMGSEPNKVLWGFPWQMNMESFGMNLGGVDQSESGKESWNNNGISSSWHGLLNTSPLM